jgi:predicted amidophosphoribosyltransferase
MTTTTYEDHHTTCPRCEQDLGPCEEHGCVNRYDHTGKVCEECGKREEE